MNLPFKCIIVDGPRAAGKTTLINELITRGSPLFPVKFREFSFGMNYESVNFPMTSPIRQDMLIRYLAQVPAIFPLPIFDRMIGTDIVMSKVQGRLTDIGALWALDKMWANIALQILLFPPISARQSRDFKGGEGDIDVIDKLWRDYRINTLIKSIVIDTNDAADIVANLVQVALEEIVAKHGA